ncbi:MAG TPA: class I SAM-dependent methyltransferase [Vicinamibacterales bacterium]
MHVAHSHEDYIPATGNPWTLALYDPLNALLGVNRVRRAIVEAADLAAARRVLDVGCGTGTLAVMIKRAWPHVDVTGLDPDPGALGVATRKAARAGVTIRFDRGLAGALPYPDGAFDRVFSSFMFHHLRSDQKREMLREVHRVLAPGGRLELVDFAGPDEQPRLLRHLVHDHQLVRDNAAADVLARLRDADFADVRRHAQTSLLVGRVNHYRGTKKLES